MEPEIGSAHAGFVELAPGTIASDYALKNLNKALGEAQAQFESAIKSEKNTYGGYTFTPLVGIIAAVRPSLTAHHLTVSQFSTVDLEARAITLYTRIVHWDSGEWMQNSIELPGDLAIGKDGTLKFNQQTIGGSQTYAQKYAYKSIVGIPDGEETIESTEYKGDTSTTSRTPSAPTPRKQSNLAPQPQPAANPRAVVERAGFFAKAKALGWGLNDIKRLMLNSYPEAEGTTAKLSDDNLADLIKIMGEWKKPDDFFASRGDQ